MADKKLAKLSNYEMLFIIPNKYTEEEAKKNIEKVKKIIENEKGNITYDEYWGKKKLAYPIKHFKHGYYALYEFDLDKKNMFELDRKLRLDNRILRYQIVSREFRTLEQIQKDKEKERNLANKFKEETGQEKQEKDISTKEDNSKSVSDNEKKQDKDNNQDDKEKETDLETKKEDKKKEDKDKEEKIELKDLDEKLDKILKTNDLL